MKLLSIIALASGVVALPQFHALREISATPVAASEFPTLTLPFIIPTGALSAGVGTAGFPTPTAHFLVPTGAASAGFGTAGFPAIRPTGTFNFPPLKTPKW
ncbi:hypothetical protein AJ78_00578 [Emergomyces pasteurianus Ep9510]|uniref:Uncharacterized protein n=1 Tax=Emergomyces pasteurianus Ep9510 TaxID=1447872 RepID=A0A1J9QW31_9EURO|nr:hypothetical protein AJ78_00578 [Emergomyces pasteurianus Ep9510]